MACVILPSQTLASWLYKKRRHVTYTKDELETSEEDSVKKNVLEVIREQTHSTHGRQQGEHDRGVSYWHTMAGPSSMLACVYPSR